MNARLKINLVRNYYRNYLCDVDIICAQELNLRGAKLEAVHNIFWPGANFFGIEVQVAYNNEDNADGARSGGIGIWLAPRLSHLIHSSGQSRASSAQWVRITGIPGPDVALLDVYAPHA